MPSEPRRKPSHPARHARQVTGAVAAGGAIVLFGWFGVTTDATANPNANANTTSRPLGPTTTTTPSSSPTRRRRSQNLPATPSTMPHPAPDTRSGGS